MTDQPTPPVLPPEGEKKPIWTRWWMIVIYTVVGLAILGSLIGGDEEGDTVVAESTSTTQGESTETTAGETTTTAEQTTTSAPASTTTTVPPTTTTTQPTTTTTESQTIQPDPVEFTGSGDEVIEFGDGLSWLTQVFGIFEFQVAGSGNNAVWALDQDFETADLLINTVGSQSGSRLLSLDYDATGLEVEVSDSWTFIVSPPTNMFPPGSSADFNVPVVDTTGTYDGAEQAAADWEGPSVIALRTDGRVAEIIASGDGNIAMWIYSSNGESDLLVNEIDEFEGSVRLPNCSDVCWIDVDGDMTYSLEVRS